MESLQGKKILILGGNSASCAIVEEAKKLGAYVIVTDWYDTKRSPAKLLADEYWNEEVFRPDILSDLVKQHNIDGVFTGYTDSYLRPYQELCELSNKFCYSCGDTFSMTVDKVKFKKACEEVGVPIVPWQEVTPETYVGLIDELEYPVVIKPTDNSGARGVFKCYDRDHYIELCIEAFNFSQEKILLVEKMMNPHNEFSAYYIFNNGKAYLSAMGDRYVYEINKSVAPVGQCMLYPSNKLSKWIEQVDPIMKQFYKFNHMNNGFCFVQGFYEDSRFYIHEIGYRLNGGFTYKIVEHFSDYNQIEQLLLSSVYGSMNQDELEKNNPFFNGYGLILTASLSKGMIGSIQGVDLIKSLPTIKYFGQLHNVGDELSSEGTTLQVFAYIICVAKDKKEMIDTIDFVERNLQVVDTCGCSMLTPMINPNRIIF